jgi:DNA repair exonuclease SbcCD ATPase subunit
MARYYIESIEIEGFKGFTEPKTINIGGKGVFIFGDNSTGKSSIVEAIRWCIFGGERREEIYRNVNYGGDTRVELRLRGSEGTVRLRRRLRPGIGKSDIDVYGPSEERLGYTELFPYISRLGGEGIDVIAATQAPSIGKPRADISQFNRVIVEYLGLGQVQKILEILAKLLEEKEDIKGRLASEAENLRKRLQSHLEEINYKIEGLLENPPWDGNIPTKDETRQKIKELISHLGKSIPPTEDLELLLNSYEAFIKEEETKGLRDLEEEARKISEEIVNLEQLKEELKQLSNSLKEAIEEQDWLKEELKEVLQGKTLDEIEKELRRLEEEVKVKALRTEILQKAKDFAQISGKELCPICENEYQDLLQRIDSSLAGASAEEKTLLSQRDKIKELYEKTKELSQQIEELQRKISSLEERKQEVINEISLAISLQENEDLEAKVEEILNQKRETLRAFRERIQDMERWIQERQREIRNLREEIRFHKLIDKRERIKWWLEKGLDEIWKPLERFEELWSSTREIQEKVYQIYNEILDRAIPPLSERMTEVYQYLTHQVSFNHVWIEREEVAEGIPKAPNLKIVVYSENNPERRWDLEKVLNEQAIRALQRLVPYFVFSHLQAEALELDLLILDDPSQTFDERRLQALFEELKKVSSHSQLIIATHEEKKFEPLLSQYFLPEQYSVLKIKGFTREEGPIIE